MFNLSKREQIIVISVLIIIISVAGMFFMKFKSFNTAKIEVQKGKNNIIQEKASVVQAVPQPTIQPTIPPKKVIVHIKGQVKNPGVLTLEEGQRVNDALIMAGGQLDKADLNAVNLAEPLSDGQEVYIPAKGEKSPAPVSKPAGQKSGASAGITSDGKIDLNTADQQQLEQLPGVGPSTATKIIEYRKANNGFKAVEELQEVPGIGAKKFEQMKNSAVVR